MQILYYRVFFRKVPPQKVLSVEDGKIPTKKVKVGLFNSKMLSFNSDFHFFGRDLPSSTLFGAEPVKKHCQRHNGPRVQLEVSLQLDRMPLALAKNLANMLCN